MRLSPFLSTVIKCKTSADGETTKLLVALQDGLQVEAVIMTYDTASGTDWGGKLTQSWHCTGRLKLFNCFAIVGHYTAPAAKLVSDKQTPEAIQTTTDKENSCNDHIVVGNDGKRGNRRATLCISSQVITYYRYLIVYTKTILRLGRIEVTLMLSCYLFRWGVRWAVHFARRVQWA